MALLLGAMALAVAPLGLVGFSIACILVGQLFTAFKQYCAKYMPANQNDQSSGTSVDRSDASNNDVINPLVERRSDESERETISVLNPVLSNHYAGLLTPPRPRTDNDASLIRTPSQTHSDE